MSQCNAREVRAAIPRGKRAVIAKTLYVYKVFGHSTALPSVFLSFSCLQCFRVNVIHRTLTLTTGSLACVRSNVLCVRIHTGVGGTPTTSEHNILIRKKLTFFLCSGRDSNRSGLGSRGPTLYQLSHHVPARGGRHQKSRPPFGGAVGSAAGTIAAMWLE